MHDGCPHLLSQLSILAAAVPPATYTAWWKVLITAILLLPWLKALPWVYRDVTGPRVRGQAPLWAGITTASGLVGFVLWLLLPVYIAGVLLYVALVASALGAYVVYRNSRVDAAHKILTAEHLTSLMGGGGGGRRKKLQLTHRVTLYRGDGSHVPEPTEPDEVEAFNVAQDLLYDMLWRRASKVDLVPQGQQTAIQFTIDGVPQSHDPIPLADGEAAIQYLKKVGGMNPEERRRPQTGSVRADLMSGKPEDIVLSTAGTTGGQRMQFRIVQEVVQTKLDELGLTDKMLTSLRSISEGGKGLVIVSGRPGNGVTSTIYSVLRSQDAFIHQLVTLEHQAEIDLENITQNEYATPEDLSGRLAAALRLDPDVVMVDKCHDEKSAELIAQASQQIIMLLGMNAADTFTALAKWMKLAGADGLQGLRAILCQALVRKLCTNCREAYKPDPGMLSKANLPAKKIDQFYRPPTKPLTDEKGRPYTCPNCQGVGYVGRTAVFEYMEITDELRQLIASGAKVEQIKAACRKQGMLYLQEQALRKVIEGTTSVDEVLRVSPTKAKKKSKS